MLPTLLRVMLLLPVLLTVLVIGVRVGYGVVRPVPPTPDLFTHPDCENPCWMGIEPGVHNMTDALAILDGQNIPVRNETALQMMAEVDDISVVLQQGPRSHELVYIKIRGQVCPVALFTELGLPDLVYRIATNVYMLYDEGFILEIWLAYPHARRFDISLTTPDVSQEQIAGASRSTLVTSWYDVQRYFTDDCF